VKLFIAGIGEAGGNVADLLVKPEGWLKRKIPTGVVGGVAFNTAVKDLKLLKFMKNRVAFGTEFTAGTGVGAKWNLARQAAEKEWPEIEDQSRDAGLLDADVILVSLGLGGGTGCGAGPAIARGFKGVLRAVERRAERGREPEEEEKAALQVLPVFALGILPSHTEPRRFKFNTYCAIANLVGPTNEYPDGLILVDNDVLFGLKARLPEEARKKKRSITTEDIRTIINPRIGECIKLMLMAGNAPANFVVDSSDCQSSMWSGFGQTGICVPGYSRMNLKIAREVTTIEDMVRSAVEKTYNPRLMSGLLAECDYTSALKALILVAGPKETLVLDELEEARNWLTREIGGGDVRVGDAIMPGNFLEVLVILTCPDVPKLDTLFNEFELYSYTSLGDLNREGITSDDIEEWKDKMSEYFEAVNRTREVQRITR
jgi:cell division GTPase FtsZ